MAQKRIVVYENNEIHYLLEQKQVKNLNLRVHKDCKVYVSAKAKPFMISSFAAVARALWMAATITFAGVEILGIGKKCPKWKRLRATHIDLILIMESW